MVHGSINPHVEPLAKKIKKQLTKIGKQLAKKVSAEYNKRGLGKAEPDKQQSQDEADAILAAALADSDSSEWLIIQQLLTPELEAQFKAAGHSLFLSLYTDDDQKGELDKMTSLLDPKARDWALDRGAELVGMRREVDDDGNVTLTENPNPEWSIEETTREDLRQLVSQGVEEGWSTYDLKNNIEDSFGFSKSRAEMIARTELAFAHVSGHLEAGQQSGATKKRVILGSEHEADVPAGDECDEAAEQGEIPIDQAFFDGYQGPPLHPNCVCDLVLVYPEE